MSMITGTATVTNFFPFVVTRLTGKRNEPEWHIWFKEMDDLLEKSQPFVLIVDLAGHVPSDAKGRAALTSYLNKTWSRAAQWVIAAPILCPNAAVRAVATGILWIAKPPVPVDFCSTASEASRLALSYGIQANLAVSAGSFEDIQQLLLKIR